MGRRRQIILKKARFPFGILLTLAFVVLMVNFGPRLLMGILVTGRLDPTSLAHMVSDENWAKDETI